MTNDPHQTPAVHEYGGIPQLGDFRLSSAPEEFPDLDGDVPKFQRQGAIGRMLERSPFGGIEPIGLGVIVVLLWAGGWL